MQASWNSKDRSTKHQSDRSKAPTRGTDIQKAAESPHKWMWEEMTYLWVSPTKGHRLCSLHEGLRNLARSRASFYMIDNMVLFLHCQRWSKESNRYLGMFLFLCWVQACEENITDQVTECSKNFVFLSSGHDTAVLVAWKVYCQILAEANQPVMMKSIVKYTRNVPGWDSHRKEHSFWILSR